MVLFLALGALCWYFQHPFTITMRMAFWFWETSLGQIIRFLHRFLPVSAQAPKSTLPQTILDSQHETQHTESNSSRDFEKEDKCLSKDCKRNEDEGLILLTWEGEMARKNPRNWSPACKAMVTLLLSYVPHIIIFAVFLLTDFECVFFHCVLWIFHLYNEL